MEPRLCYCGNVHAAEDLDAWLRAVVAVGAPVARATTPPGRAAGLGVWWNASVARRLATDASARARVADELARNALQVWTLNVFPFGGFHDREVKLAVYAPDWSEPARLEYTIDAARAAALLAPMGQTVPMSTLPLGYRSGDTTAMASQLATAARELARLSDRHGRELVLALEPEPMCLLETARATGDFLEERVFHRARDEAVLRRHLGVCVDLCHLAVVDEEPLAALEALARRGVRVPKIQVSSCIEVREPARARAALLAFAEPRYLHQTVADNGARALDLAEVAERWPEFAAARRIRTHFHLPVFWDDPGALGSTRGELERVLPRLSRPLPLLEVETYTWSVLDPAWRPERDLVAGLARELEFVRNLVSA